MTTPEELDALQERLENLRSLAAGPGDPIREPRRSHIARYHDALAKAWEAGAFAALRARVAELEAERDGFKRNLRESFEAMCAMRDSINEYLPMPSLESDLLRGPETSVFCATVTEAIVSELARREQGVQVNLVWEDLDGYAWRATAPLFGSFRVERYGNGPWQALWSVPGYCATFVDGGFATAEDAKQAIEARIRAALVSPGDGVAHASDCAVHNAPAYPPGPCDCGAAPPASEGA